MVCDFNPRWFWTSTNIKDILKIIPKLDNPIFHICSGFSGIGDIRIDRSYINESEGLEAYKCALPEYRASCNIKGDMMNIPFKDGVAGSIICDPPYKYNFTKPDLIGELVRICKPGGKILFIAPWVPNHKHITFINNELWKVGKNGAYHKIRSLFYKSNGQMGDYQ